MVNDRDVTGGIRSTGPVTVRIGSHVSTWGAFEQSPPRNDREDAMFYALRYGYARPQVERVVNAINRLQSAGAAKYATARFMAKGYIHLEGWICPFCHWGRPRPALGICPKCHARINMSAQGSRPYAPPMQRHPWSQNLRAKHIQNATRDVANTKRRRVWKRQR